MSTRPSMLINLPPPPSDPYTPSEMGPGTPNSTATSLSALSVVAIKDGAVGHGGRGGASSANTLEAERADRISRLAGLERVGTVRPTASGHLLPGAGPGSTQQYDHIPQYKERSTVGSASATGSVGGRTTWASEMDYDADKMSEDQDDGVSSVGGLSDEDKASLVGFGEGAGSTMSGPVSTANGRIIAARNNFVSPPAPRIGTSAAFSGQSTPMSGVVQTGPSGGPDFKMMDGMNYDHSAMDTSSTPPLNQQAGSRFGGSGADMAEHIMRDKFGDVEMGRRAIGTPDSQGLGRFPFEKE